MDQNLSDGSLPFVPMSGGLDPGVIVVEEVAQGLKFFVYCAPEGEDIEVIGQRLALLDHHRIPYELVLPTGKEIQRTQELLQSDFGDFAEQAPRFPEHHHNPGLANIPGYVAAGVIYSRAINRGLKTSISGVACDGITTDYASGSLNLSSMRGNWRLAQTQKWRNCGGGWQSVFLQAAERVAGQFGVESRFPFLDKAVVSEFVNLPIPACYEPLKRPLIDFPMSQEKRGFLGVRR